MNKTSKHYLLNSLFYAYLLLACGLLLGFVLLFIKFMLWQSASLPSWYQFTSGASAFGQRGGLLSATIGSLCLGFGAAVIAGVLAMLVAVADYLYIKSVTLRRVLQSVIRTMASVPSTVLGLFGYAFFVQRLQFGLSLIAGMLTLAIMIFPYLELRFYKQLNEIDINLVNTAKAFGVKRQYLLWYLLLPLIRKQALRSVALQMSFAMGATAPLMMTTGVLNAPVPSSLSDPVMSLPHHLYLILSQGLDRAEAYQTCTILLLLVFVINVGAFLLTLEKNV